MASSTHLINIQPQCKSLASGPKAPSIARFAAGLKPRPTKILELPHKV
jgi:hypothetical protein